MLRAFLLYALIASAAMAQGVLGVIHGRVLDEVDGGPVPSSKVSAVSRESGESYRSDVWKDGSFALVLLPPGVYDVTVTAGLRYRTAVVKGLEVPVAGFVEREFTLSLLSDIWQNGLSRSSVPRDRKTVLQFYGPDVDISRSQVVDSAAAVRGYLEPSITDVVSSGFIDNLPLAGRDVYELITMQPGAANDLTTIRSTGVSVNGQRPSASSFLLDGRENNNYLVTGAFAPLPPEAVAEYRVATNNFAAEYGRTSGYLANAVTNRGSTAWHGLGYGYLNEDWLNATPTQPSSSVETGVRVTGPLGSHRLFDSSVFDFARDHVRNPDASYQLPTWQYIDSLDHARDAWKLLSRFRPSTEGGAGPVQTVDLESWSTSRRITTLQRADWDPSDRRHLTASVTGSWQAQPDFFRSPYPDFTTGLHQNAFAAAATYEQVLGPVNAEFRAALTRDSLGWDNPHPEIPQLRSSDAVLPSATPTYFLMYQGTTVDAAANFLVSTPRHVIKWGGGMIGRSLSGAITIPAGNLGYNFQDLGAFARDQPCTVGYTDARHLAIRGEYGDPRMSRRYRYVQTFAFAQDSFHVSRRLLLHYGIRFDYFGSPANIGAQKDSLIALGPGNTLQSKLGGADFLPLPTGNQRLYDADGNDAAARVGFALNLRANGDTILRGSYGIFYDRPFDNLWLNLRFNDAVPASTTLGVPNLDYLATPLSQVLQSRRVDPNLQLYPLTLYQPGLRTPYVNSFFVGVQHKLSDAMLLDVNYAGSLARKLLTTDKVNRMRSVVGCSSVSGNSCRPDSNLDADIEYRGNQGTSEYHALVSSLRIRYRRGEARLSYTYSHAIDNQSDPLTGLLAHNLQVTQPGASALDLRPAAFTVQYDSSVDRGSADFDQRHNVVFYSYLQLPAPRSGPLRRLLNGWSLAEVGAVRSGSPFTIYSQFSPDPLHYNRADLISPQLLTANTGPVPGGRLLLNPASFADAARNRLGTAGRNAFTGPGSYTLDLSVSRSFHISRARDSLLLVVRADAYNSLNHVNLGNPLPENLSLGSPDFALAGRNRIGAANGLLSAAPFSESARRFQLLLRVVF
jgi:hypothetical protein